MNDQPNSAPLIGIIMLDTVFPRIVGDIGNPASFPFPVRYRVVKGASAERVVMQGDPELLEPFTLAARELVGLGVKAISTSCGFLALFQKELAAAVPVPVLSSSLLQVHLARAFLRPGQKVGVITARLESLSQRHLAGVGIGDCPLVIAGMEHMPEFRSVFLEGKTDLDSGKCREEMLEVTGGLLHEHPEIGALVLECTNMPPYSNDLRRAFRLPVFDVLTMLNCIHQSLAA